MNLIQLFSVNARPVREQGSNYAKVASVFYLLVMILKAVKKSKMTNSKNLPKFNPVETKTVNKTKVQIL